MTERLKKDIIKLIIDEVVIEGESVKIFATIPLPNKIHEREMDKTDIPGTFSARGGSAFGGNATSGATLGPVNETNMTRIWNKHKQSNTPLKRKVLVAMSGGVDSSVAAALLKKEGYEVTGGFMKNFSRESWHGVIDDDCPWEADFEDVKKVCEVLKIPYRSFNFEKEYKEQVIEYFFREYETGRTPNPDIMCNKKIKFKIFLDKARELGFDYIATGHYIRLRRKFPIPNSQFPIFELLKGKDTKKDQSYFLYTLNQEQLAKTLFPIGNYKKSEIRALARKFKLSNAEKKDSQGICFVGHIDLKEFLKQRIPQKEGVIADSSGNGIGRHSGAWYYTIGQRRGIGIGGGSPYYVIEKDVKKNIIIVTENKKDKKLFGRNMWLSETHWIYKKPKFPLLCKAKIRYQQKDQPCVVRLRKNVISVEFKKPQFAPAVGQSIVFYKANNVLGGGIVEKIEKLC